MKKESQKLHKKKFDVTRKERLIFIDLIDETSY